MSNVTESWLLLVPHELAPTSDAKQLKAENPSDGHPVPMYRAVLMSGPEHVSNFKKPSVVPDGRV